MSIAEITDDALADEAREPAPPGERKKGPASVEALGRAIADTLTNLGEVERESPGAQADAATLDAFSTACGDAAMRLAELALRRKGVLS